MEILIYVSLYSGHILTQKLQIMQNALRLPEIEMITPIQGGCMVLLAIGRVKK